MKKRNNEDIKIRTLLDNNLPQAPQNPWFVNKTINCLPQKQRNSISIIEFIGYAIAIMIIVGLEINIIYNFITTGSLTINNIIWLISLNIGLYSIVASMLSPHLRNLYN